MAKFNERLRALRLSAGMSQQVLADRLKISKSSVNMYERGEREPGIGTLTAAAEIFGVDMNYLTGAERLSAESNIAEFPNILPIRTKRVPLLGTVACGEPIFADETRGDYVDCGEDIGADFCLRASGDSMTGARIYDGDMVFCRSQNAVDNGDIAAVIIGDEATLKRVYYYPESGKLVLQAENPKYEPFVFVGRELEKIRIIGKAVAFRSNIK